MRLRSTVLLLVASSLFAQTPPPTQQDPSQRVVATVNGETITSYELDQMWARLTPQMRENYEKSGGKVQFLDTYIRRRLVIQEALKQGFERRPDVALDLQLVRETTLFDRYVRDVVGAQVVSESDVQAYYKANQQEFMQPEMIRVRHIIATPQDQPVMNTTGDNAKSDAEALEKIKRIAMMFKTVGGNFVDVAQKYSEDATARAGGDLGWFARGKMVPAFEEAAFNLQKRGDTTGVVKTEFGYHVLVLEDRRAAGVRPFAEVRDGIREKLVRNRQVEVMEELTRLTQELRAASKISVYADNL